MKIVADENIPLVDEFFGDIGEVLKVGGRDITNALLEDADILLVRSVTPVDAALLQQTKVSFVGTATIGCDHIDEDYLKQERIGFASAPGSNANAVAEYIVATLSVLSEMKRLSLQGKTIGIIGYGNVGTRVHKKLSKLGVQCLANDPPLKDEGHEDLVSLEEALDCDIITIHTPLTDTGEYPTRRLISAEHLAGLNSDQVLINTARGGVIDGQALLEYLSEPGPKASVVLDVWEDEPAIDEALLQKVTIGTPHIAGYSVDGKVAGTEMLYRALCQFLGLPARFKAGQFLEEPPLSKLTFTSQADVDWATDTAVRACFDPRHDDANLRNLFRGQSSDPVSGFDQLRKNYRPRREFKNVKVSVKGANPELNSRFKALGFTVKPS